ncbi:Hypothetical predicted protein [Pelobates cultripes]|uniref:Uncharacterized protein n=1 Tax=Pelobates cultripes TaxID=61616 RepID=A0AAD1VJF6_PELCU|nr:Hypothetical predicted protein [Pelobates cultripes]
MAAATCARDTEKPDLETKLDELFARFWRTIATREQQAKACKPVTVLPVNSQQECTPPHVNKVHKQHRGRQKRRARKPKRLPLPKAATHHSKCLAKLNLPERHEQTTLQQRNTASNKEWTRPGDHGQTMTQLLRRHHPEVYPHPGRPRRQHHEPQHSTSHRLPHDSRSTSPERGSDLAVAQTSCIIRSGLLYYTTKQIPATRQQALRSGVG